MLKTNQCQMFQKRKHGKWWYNVWPRPYRVRTNEGNTIYGKNAKTNPTTKERLEIISVQAGDEIIVCSSLFLYCLF